MKCAEPAEPPGEESTTFDLGENDEPDSVLRSIYAGRFGVADYRRAGADGLGA